MKSSIKVRPLIATSVALALALALGACGDDGTSPRSDPAGATKNGGDRSKVTIQIDGAAVPYYAPLYMAKEKGYFAKQALDVEFIYADASTVLKNVAAGNVEFGFPNGDAVISAAASRVPVKVVHCTYQQGIGAVLSVKSAGINKPEDLKGKTVGVTSLGSPNYVQLQVMAAKAGLDVKKDMKVKTVGTNVIVDALKSGDVDAIVFSRLRYYALKSSGVDANQILTDRFLPSFGNVLVTSGAFLKENPAIVKKFIIAFDQAIKDIIENGANEAVETSIQKYAPDFQGQGDSITQIMNEVFVKELYQSEKTKSNGIGYCDMSRWQTAAGIQHKYGSIKSPVQAEEFVVQPNSVQ